MMGYLTLLKIIGPIALLAALAWGFSDWQAKRRDVAAEHACQRSISRSDGDLSACTAPVRAAVETARMSDACDAALGQPRDSGLFAVRAACSAPVKQLVADDAAALAARDSAEANERDAASDRDAAIGRAEARVQQFQDKVKANDTTLGSAPRGADGSILCDAGCLRNLAN